MGAQVKDRELAVGEAGVLRRGLSLIEVYRDPSGRIIDRWAACSRRDCRKRWDGNGGRWTCPCHEN